MRLGDVAREVRVTDNNPLEEGLERYVGLEHLDPQELRICRWGNIADGVTFNKKFNAGQILFGRRRAYQKKAAVPDFSGICSGDITVIEAVEGAIVPELLPYIIQSDSFFEYAVSESAGSLSPRVKWKHLANYEFNLPDKDTQRIIAELMQAFDESIYSAEKLVEATIANKEIIIYEMLENEANLVSLVEIGEFKGGSGFPVKYQGQTQQDIPFFKVSDMNLPGNDILMKTANNYISNETREEIGANLFPPNTIIFAKIGAALFHNRKRLLTRPSCIDNNMMGYVVTDNHIDFRYVYQFLLGLDFGDYANVGAIPSLSQDRMNEIKIPLLSSEEQESFVGKTKELDKIIQYVIQKNDTVKNLKSLVLSKLLNSGGETQ